MFERISDRKYDDSLQDIYDIPINVINNLLYYQNEKHDWLLLYKYFKKVY